MKYRNYEQRKAFKRGVASIKSNELWAIVVIGVLLTWLASL